MRNYLKFFVIFAQFFYSIFLLDSCKNLRENSEYTPVEKSDAPEQCKLQTKPLTFKLFYEGKTVVPVLWHWIRNANITFEKRTKMLEIESKGEDIMSAVIGGKEDSLLVMGEEGKIEVISYYNIKKVRLQLKVDFINPEYLEKITGQNLFVWLQSWKGWSECHHQEECEELSLVPDTIRDFYYMISIYTKADSLSLEDILLYIFGGVGGGLLPYVDFSLEIVDDSGECPFLLWRESWVFNDFCCLLFEGASECRCISSERKIMEEICSCQNRGNVVAKKVAVKFGQNVILPGQTVKVGKFVVGVADATRFKFEGKKIETLWDFVSFYMVRVE